MALESVKVKGKGEAKARTIAEKPQQSERTEPPEKIITT